MKIAIASSGLGHVARGIETWAVDTAGALARAQVISDPLSVIRNTNNQQQITNNIISVTLFAAAPLPHLTSKKKFEQKLAKDAKPLRQAQGREEGDLPRRRGEEERESSMLREFETASTQSQIPPTRSGEIPGADDIQQSKPNNPLSSPFKKRCGNFGHGMPSVALAKAGIPWTKYPQHLISRFLSLFPLRTSVVKSLPSRSSRASVQTLDSHLGRLAHVSPLTICVIPCLKRGDRFVKLLARILPGFTWRWGLKSAYDIEQRSFWRHLWPILRDEKFDILHVQDPLLADLCRRYRKAGKLRTKEILAHGTEEPVEFLEKFEYVQHLAPWHLEQTLKQIEEKRGLHH